MIISTVSFLVVAQSSSEVPEGLMNNPVYIYRVMFLKLKYTIITKNTYVCIRS